MTAHTPALLIVSAVGGTDCWLLPRFCTAAKLLLPGLLVWLGEASPLVWRPPVAEAVCSSSTLATGIPTADPSLTMTRQKCTLPKAKQLTPESAVQSDMRLRTPSANLTLFFSPAWNSWSLSGAPIIYGSVDGSTFLYAQLLNSSGALIDACPIPTWAQTLEPQYHPRTAWPEGAPGVSPCEVANVTSVGWKPPLPAVELTLLTDLVLTNGLLLSREGVPSTATERATIFLQMHSALLLMLTPDVTEQEQVDDWVALAVKSERDLRRSGSQVTFAGQQLLRSYYNDRRAGGESVTQMDVLEPLRRWNSSCALHVRRPRGRHERCSHWLRHGHLHRSSPSTHAHHYLLSVDHRPNPCRRAPPSAKTPPQALHATRHTPHLHRRADGPRQVVELTHVSYLYRDHMS